MRTGRVAATVIVVIAVGAGGWLLRDHDAAHSAAPTGQAIPVTAGTAQAQDVPVFIQGIGTVQAISTVNVKSRVDGEILRAFFTEGQEVHGNDQLFLIDPRPYQAGVDQAKANAGMLSAALLLNDHIGTMRTPYVQEVIT